MSGFYYVDAKKNRKKLDLKWENQLGEDGNSGVVIRTTIPTNENGLIEVAAKIFHEPIDVRTMIIVEQIRNSPIFLDENESHFILPVKDIYFEDTGAVHGYIMPLARDFQSLESFYHSSYRYDLNHSIEYAIHLCDIVDRVHQAGFYIQDLSTKNLMVNDKNKALILIDMDSLGTLEYPPPHNAPDGFIAPSHYQGHKIDNFIAGIHIAQLLFGYNPFSGIELGSDKIERSQNIESNNSWIWKASMMCGDVMVNKLPDYIVNEIQRLLSHDSMNCPENLSLMRQKLIKFRSELQAGRKIEKIKLVAPFNAIYKNHGGSSYDGATNMDDRVNQSVNQSKAFDYDTLIKRERTGKIIYFLALFVFILSSIRILHQIFIGGVPIFNKVLNILFMILYFTALFTPGTCPDVKDQDEYIAMLIVSTLGIFLFICSSMYINSTLGWIPASIILLIFILV